MIRKLSLATNIPYEVLYRRIKLIRTFIAGQGALQLIQLLSGFMLIRWLSIEEYAQYSLAFAFQSTAQMLVEFGFSGAIVALVSRRIHDKAVIGNYIKAGKYYRNRFFIIIGGACFILFPILAAQHEWPVLVTVLLLICIISNLYFSGNISYYTSPLKIHKAIGTLYNIQVKNGLIRALFIVMLYGASILNAWLAALTTSLLTISNGFAFRKKASVFIKEPNEASPEIRKEMFNYIRPIMPGIVFAAFQGQIMIFIISIFGGTQDIAEIGALSRLGQLYIVFNMAGGILVAPYFAQQKSEGLLKKYLFILSLAILLSGVLVGIACVFPNILLWIIGDKYQHLQSELVLLIINSGLALIIGFMWQMNASRKWIYSWMPWVSIPGTLAIQILFAWGMDLNNTNNVLLFSIVTSLYVLANRILVSIVGFNKLKT